MTKRKKERKHTIKKKKNVHKIKTRFANVREIIPLRPSSSNKRKNFEASIKYTNPQTREKKSEHVGTYSTAEEAARAVDEKRRKLHRSGDLPLSINKLHFPTEAERQDLPEDKSFLKLVNKRGTRWLSEYNQGGVSITTNGSTDMEAGIRLEERLVDLKLPAVNPCCRRSLMSMKCKREATGSDRLTIKKEENAVIKRPNAYTAESEDEHMEEHMEEEQAAPGHRESLDCPALERTMSQNFRNWEEMLNSQRTSNFDCYLVRDCTDVDDTDDADSSNQDMALSGLSQPLSQDVDDMDFGEPDYTNCEPSDPLDGSEHEDELFQQVDLGGRSPELRNRHEYCRCPQCLFEGPQQRLSQCHTGGVGHQLLSQTSIASIES